LKKRSKKLLTFGAGLAGSLRTGTRVFWFFFSKKNIFFLFFCASAHAAALDGILHDYDAWLTEADPIGAAARGDMGAARRWPDDSPAAVQARMARLATLRDRLAAISPGSLAGEDRLNRDLLAWRMDIDLRGAAFDEDRIAFTSDEGFFVTPAYTADDTVLRSVADAQAWLARLHALPAYYAAETANMRRGLASGFIQPRLTAETAARTTAAQAGVPAEADPLLAPMATLPQTVPAEARAALRAQALAIITDEVKPAERKLAEFFATVYVPKSRASLGAASLPDGRAYYAYLVRRETTTDLTPDQIFAIGQSEIARIRAAMEVQIKASGFAGSFADFQAMLRRDPRFYVTSREALLERASRLAKMVDGELPLHFGKLPRLSYGVRAVPAAIEEGYTSARYFPGSPQQGIAGGLMINTSQLDQRPLYELPALVAHEGAPGHHIQIALGQELTGLPAFRQDSEITAFVEGWAVYAEQLVAEMGLYRTPYERFGMLSMEMWRACRLVMDVGIHWKGWSRDQALSCLRENTALAETNMQNEVNRYIAWPGQALGYKIGELKIMELRQRAEAKLGASFDERAFHDVVLDEGAMPLAVLEQRVDTWIAAAQGRKKG
jgi:uncharacterized protein (DUF885 family)